MLCRPRTSPVRQGLRFRNPHAIFPEKFPTDRKLTSSSWCVLRFYDYCQQHAQTEQVVSIYRYGHNGLLSVGRLVPKTLFPGDGSP